MKKLISILILGVMLSIFIPHASAENPYTYEINSVRLQYLTSGIRVTASVTNLTKKSTNDLIIAAAYSSDNKLLGMNSASLALGPLQSSNPIVSIAANYSDVAYVKVFTWDSWSNIQPFSDSWNTVQTKTINFAVLLKVTDNNEVVLLNEDGTTSTYFISSSSVLNLAKEIEKNPTASGRIVTYTKNSLTGELSTFESAASNGQVSVTPFSGRYTAQSSKIGNISISSTNVIDASRAEGSLDTLDSASNYSFTSSSELIDSEFYYGYAFKEDDCVSFVVITSIGKKIDDTYRFAVVQEPAVPHYTSDDEECELVLSLYNGRAKNELLFPTGLYDTANLGVGDAFFFEKDKYGFITKVYKVYDHSTKTCISLTEALGDSAVDNLLTGSNGWSYNLWNEGYSIQLAKGIIYETSDNYVSFASEEQIKTGSLDANLDLDDTKGDGIVTYGVCNDIEVYVYDIYSEEYDEGNKLSTKSVSSIKASNFDAYEIDSSGVYSGIDMDDANEALALIVDGDIAAIYVIQKN